MNYLLAYLAIGLLLVGILMRAIVDSYYELLRREDRGRSMRLAICTSILIAIGWPVFLLHVLKVAFGR